MEWENTPVSMNVEDRRGSEGGAPFGGGSGGLGLGAIVVLALIGYFTGIDPRLLIGGAEILTGGSNGAGGDLWYCENIYKYLTLPAYGACVKSDTEGFVGRVTAADGSTHTLFTDAWGQAIRFYWPLPDALKPFAANAPPLQYGYVLDQEKLKWQMNGYRPYIWSWGPDNKGWTMREDRPGAPGFWGSAANQYAQTLQDIFYLKDAILKVDNEDNLSNFRDIPLPGQM